jgi:glyoxalase family protein
LRRFDEQVLAFSDPDGLLLELVATPRAAGVLPWSEVSLPPEHAIRGLHGATIWEDGDNGSAEFLTRMMHFEPAGEEGGLLRFQSAPSGLGTVINLRRASGFWKGAGGVGTVHHLAFRAANASEQLERRSQIEARGLSITPVIDRQYFHSVYFREPGDVLFEIATDGPGFMIDEPAAELGTRLQLPPIYEPNRSEIERALPPLRLPQAAAEEGR